MSLVSAPSTACQSPSACMIAKSSAYTYCLETVVGRSEKRRGAETDPCGTPFLRRHNLLLLLFPVVRAGLWSRKDFQPEESESQKILTTPGRPAAHQLWRFAPQTCVSVTLGNLSSLTFQQEMSMAIQKGYSALTCIPTLRDPSRSTASLGLITQSTLWLQPFGACITEISICAF